MILYVNGDSHAAAAEAVNLHAFAEDDPDLFHMGRAPHPDNLAVGWPKLLANALEINLCCDAESASSNARILRTTHHWLDQNRKNLSDTLIVISWSTWERQEWLIDGIYYQINASGIDDVPISHRQLYKEFVASVDWDRATQQAHEDIWLLHEQLNDIGVCHVFFNGNNDFSRIKNRKNWGVNYINPYDPESTYSATLIRNGYQTVAPNSWHFGKEAHSFWSRFMLQYIVNNKMI